MKTKYFNQTNLVDAGWTKGLIDKYLGQPDAYYENPHYSKAAPIKRYEETRVIETIQANNLSDALNKRVEKRKTTSAKRFTKKVQQLSETFVLEKGHEKNTSQALGCHTGRP